MSRQDTRQDRRPDRMNQRLDEELRNAFRREQPSADFTARILERVSLEPMPRLRWWQKLAMLLEPPKLRWVAIGVTASLLLAIGVMQYAKMQQVGVDTSVQVAKENPSSSAASDKGAVDAVVDRAPKETVTNKPVQIIKHASALATNNRPVSTRHQQEREMRAEGEAAKEKLMLALAIASSALSDAQKAVHDDGVEP